MTGESGHFTGSDWHFRTTNRHGFPENRHGYFKNPSICPRFDGIMPIACPEKAAFGTVTGADNSENGLQYVQYAGTGKTKFSNRTLIWRCPWGHCELRKNKPIMGSVYPSRRGNRHGFLENRHGYFANPLICSRIAGMIPLTCPEKAAFSTVTGADNSQNGLQYVQCAGMKGMGDLDHVPLLMEIEYRGPGYRAGRTNDEHMKTDREN